MQGFFLVTFFEWRKVYDITAMHQNHSEGFKVSEKGRYSLHNELGQST